MDSKLVLVKLITLLYYESLCRNVQDRSIALAHDIIYRLKLPDQVTETESGRNVIVGLRETVLWICDHAKEEPMDVALLMQRVRLNAGEDATVFQAFEDVLAYVELPQEELAKICQSLDKEIRGFLNQMAVREIVNKAYRGLFYDTKGFNLRQYVENLVAELETYHKDLSKDGNEFIMNLISSKDPESLKMVLDKAKDRTEGTGGFKTGWQAFNRMLGSNQMLRRGMFVLVGGLTHMYKSGLTHDLFRHFCIHNDPVQENPDKKPMVIYISVENELEEDVMRMYVALKENETGKAVDVSMVDSAEASEYVSKRLGERGWHAVMTRMNPHDFTYTDLFNLVLHYEAEGYEIHAMVFDYLTLINKKGCQSTMIGEDVRQLIQKTRTFMSSRNILFVSPHQLSQEAMAHKRAGVSNFLKEIAGRNYWDGSKRIANEVDLEVYVDIVERNKKHYMHIHRGKHRTVKRTPSEYHEFYIPFQEVGYVPDDIHKEDTSLKDVNYDATATAIDFD